MTLTHNAVEYIVRKEWMLEDLKTRLTYDEWEKERRHGTVRKLLLEHNSKAYFAVEYESGDIVVALLAPGVVYNLSPENRKEPMTSKAGPMATYMKRRAEEALAEKMKKKPREGISTIIKKGIRQPAEKKEVEPRHPEPFVDDDFDMKLAALEERFCFLDDNEKTAAVRKLLDAGNLKDAEAIITILERRDPKTEVVTEDVT